MAIRCHTPPEGLVRLRPRVGKTGPIAVGDVLRDGGGVAAILLKHKGNAAAQILLVYGADIAPRHSEADALAADVGVERIREALATG
jgi:hypothetical protein